MSTESSMNEINPQMYIKVAILLVILTVLTYIQHIYLPLDTQGTFLVQMVLAFSKAGLIVSYYMHLKYESNVFKILAGITAFILLIIFLIIAVDIYYMNNKTADFFQ